MRNLCISLVAVVLVAGCGAGVALADDSTPEIGGVVMPKFTDPQGDLTTDRGTPPVSDHDPSVTREHTMPSNTVYTIFWIPPGYSVSTNYVSLINGYFQNVAHDDGLLTNVYSDDTQYGAGYDTIYGGTYTDTTAFPSNGCTDSHTTVCLTDAQLQTEITADMTAEGWTRSPTNLFFIYTPQGVGSCTTAGSTSCAFSQYCAYHSFYGTYANPVIYANMPYAALTGFDGCLTYESPNGDDADATINVMSHEHNEAITDPYLWSWYDSSGNEIADECEWLFGAPLGGNPGAKYNEVINGAHYYLQMLWSNEDSGCVQNMTNPANTVVPSLSGSNQNGLAMSGTTGTWTNPVYTYNGTSWVSSTPTYAYQWQRCDSSGNNCVNIPGATSSSYTFVNADVGSTARIGVTASVGHTTSPTPVYSLHSAIVGQMAVPSETVPPAISGTAQNGVSLSTSTGTWTSNVTPTFSYQWQRCDSGGNNCANISGATGSTYSLVSADIGSTVRVAVSATNAGGTSAANNSAPSSVVAQMAAPSTTGTPSISGSALVGTSLSAANASWTSNVTPTFAWQWQRCDSAGSNCANIASATATAYTLVSADIGFTIRVEVSATNAGGTAGPLMSAQTAVVALPSAPANTVAPSISGTAQTGSVLSVVAGTWTGTGISLAYQWQSCDSGGGTCVNVSGATSTSYTLQSSDAGATFRVLETATNSGGSASATSAATGVVSAPASPSDGGGGGGGGGGGAADAAVSVSGPSTPVSPGSGFPLYVTVTNSGGGADVMTLTLNLSGLVYQGSQQDFGPACSASGETVTCSIDGFVASQQILVFVQVSGLPASAQVSVYASGDTALANNSATWSAVSPAPPAPAPVSVSSGGGASTPARTTETASASTTVVSAVTVTPVTLTGSSPAIALTVKVSKTAPLELMLVDSKGTVVAKWHASAHSGTAKLTLKLPPVARKPGHDTIRIVAGTKTVKTVAVTIKR